MSSSRVSIEFPSLGATLRGRLYLPDAPAPHPVVVMAHGFSATIDMVADRFAEAFQAEGLAVVLYDHRNLGASGGEPRQEISPWVQARGYIDAIDWAVGRPELDANRIALWGDSLSGGEVTVVAAVDARVRAIVAQVPGLGMSPPAEPPTDAYREAVRVLLASEDPARYAGQASPAMMVVSPDQGLAPSRLATLTAYRWFMEYGGRHRTGWTNRVTFVAAAGDLPWQPGRLAPWVGCDVLWMPAPDDEIVGADYRTAMAAFDAMTGYKELVEAEGGHFGLLWHPGERFTRAASLQAHFLIRRLTGSTRMPRR